MLNKISTRTWIFSATSFVVFVLDQLTKYWAIARLTNAFDPVASGNPLNAMARLGRFLWYKHPLRSGDIVVFENFWRFRYVENPGAAWGFLSGTAESFRTPFFLVISIVAMVFILSYFRRSLPEQKMLRVALALVFGGAIGNFVDRIRLTYVIDFIEWHWYGKSWPVFNVADAAISVGVGLLLLDMLVNNPEKKKSTSESPA